MKIIKFPFKDTGKPRIVIYMDGCITVAMQVIVKGNKGQNLKRYQVAHYDINSNKYLVQALTTKNYIGQEQILDNFVSLEKFNQVKLKHLFTNAAF